ncbi:cadherin-like beta sandwich domain-containing protein, partial [bacterium]|nr:cadherin-like beta sandwich domain-containing protein [bacterium]
VNVYADGKVVTDNLDTTNTLDSITVSDCTLDPVFNTATTEYSCTVKNNISTVNINATATSSKSKVRGLGTRELTVGKNTLPIRVIAEDGSEKIYNVNITRKREATSLKNEIMKNKIITANPTLTTSSNNTSDASGLYASTATNTGKPTYYFRGNVENNYVNFAGFTWRIVRINEDGTIRIIMQDGINNNARYQFNLNNSNYTHMYYSNSQVKPILENWYQTNIGSKLDLAKNVVSGAYYCEQAKAKQSDSATSGSATMTTYNKYTPDFKCSSDGNGKGQVNASVGLLTYDEVVYAGGYTNQNNSNYYLNNPVIYWWTMSPDGFSGSFSNVWIVNSTGSVSDTYVVNSRHLRPVLSLNADTQISDGDGSKENPFTIE